MEIEEFDKKSIAFEFTYRYGLPINIEIGTQIVKKVMSVLIDRFGINNNFTCVALCLLNEYDDRVIKKVSYIHFPYIICERIHHIIIRNIIEKICTCDNIVVSEVEDRCLYLSSKSRKNPFEILKIYNNDELDALLYQEKTYDSILAFVNLLSARTKNNLLVQPIQGAEFFNYPLEKKIIENLPKIEYDLNIVVELLNILRKSTTCHYKQCINICAILYYCQMTDVDKNINFKKIWLKWSKKKNISNAIDRWKYVKKFTYYSSDIKSLYYYAHVNDPISFEKIATIYPAFRKMML